MSAFICHEDTFSRILSGFHVWANNGAYFPRTKNKLNTLSMGYRNQIGDDFDQFKPIVNALYSLNVDAVDTRYNEKNEKQSFKIKMNPNISKGQFLKSLDCLLYQMSEGDIPETELYKTIKDLADTFAGEIARNTEEYETADWE